MIFFCFCRWYQQKSFSSFQRQLIFYGFRLITDGKSQKLKKEKHVLYRIIYLRSVYFELLFAGPDKGSYYHRFFIRGKSFLADCINLRKGMKKISAEAVPDFYQMSFLPTQCLNNKIEPNTIPKECPITETKSINEILK